MANNIFKIRILNRVLFQAVLLPLFLIKVGFIANSVFPYAVARDTAGEADSLNIMDYGTLMDQQKLVKNEQKLVGALLNYTTETQDLIYRLKTFITAYTENAVEPLKNSSTFNIGISKENKFIDSDVFAENLVKDPFLGFQLLRRFSTDFPVLESQIKNYKTSEERLRNFIVKSKTEYNFPSRPDLRKVMTSVTYLMILYNLNLDDLEDGKIVDNVTSTAGFTPEQFYEFGFFAERRDIFTLAINLLDKAKSLLNDSSESGASVDSETKELGELIDRRLKMVIKSHNEELRKVKTGTGNGNRGTANGTNPFLLEEEITAIQNNGYNNRKLITFRPNKSADGSMVTDNQIVTAFHKFPELCQGKNLETDNNFENKNPPKCFLHVSHAYYTIGPLKVEILSKDPLVIQYHDIVPHGQIQRMKDETGVRLRRSRVLSLKGEDKTDISRLSSTADAEETDDLTRNWNRKVELITGLGATTSTDSEILQITNYATGAHFLPHLDAFYVNQVVIDALGNGGTVMGDRLATFMFYLSPVHSGGRTAFPELGLSAEPIEGSALFWFNLHPNGTVDGRLLHGGCPILYGTKWIATKWIRSNDQMFRQKCSPQDTSMRPITAGSVSVDDQNHGHKKSQRKENWFYNSYGFEKKICVNKIKFLK